MERTPGTGQTAVPGFFKLLASNPKRRSRSTASEPRASSENFAGLMSLPVSFHFGPRREFITLLGGAAAARGTRAAGRSHATHQRAQRVNGRGLSIPSSQRGIPARTWCWRAPKLVDEIKPIGDQAAAGSINRECYRRRVIPKLADPDSSCVSPSEPQKIVRWSNGIWAPCSSAEVGDDESMFPQSRIIDC